VSDLDFGEIEWYHRLRNELYHQGNGLTVERQKVETYATIAKILFKNLFGFDLFDKRNLKNALELDLEQYLELWGKFELMIQTRKKNYKAFEKSTIEILNELVEKKLIDEKDLEIIEEYKNYRNKLVHSQMKVNDIPFPKKEKYVPYILNIMTKIQGFEM
jgi:type IV secretory pathway VirB4 component